jgi:hypothetical protein
MRVAFAVVTFVGWAAVAACGDDHTGPNWLGVPKILVKGVGIVESNCRDNLCPHNENVDSINFNGAIYMMHRTAESQVLNHNCALHVFKTTDGGATWDQLATLRGPSTDATPPSPFGNRDLRDPSFDIVNGQLAMKALIRLEKTSSRDSFVDTITVGTVSSDGGTTWSDWAPLTTPVTGDGWSFWRIKDFGGMHYAAAYEDGDKQVVLYSSPDGVTWTPGAQIYGVSADTPLETELQFMPSGTLLALVRVDGTDDELLGNIGRLRTIVCWAHPPYSSFSCPQVFDGQRLDGPVSFLHDGRLFVIARKHFIETADRKRTSLYEITGTLDGGPIGISEIGELPSAGDTSYAGVADVDPDHVLVNWYSSYIPSDEPWARAILEAADIWQTTLDMRAVPPPPTSP